MPNAKKAAPAQVSDLDYVLEWWRLATLGTGCQIAAVTSRAETGTSLKIYVEALCGDRVCVATASAINAAKCARMLRDQLERDFGRG